MNIYFYTEKIYYCRRKEYIIFFFIKKIFSKNFIFLAHCVARWVSQSVGGKEVHYEIEFGGAYFLRLRGLRHGRGLGRAKSPTMKCPFLRGTKPITSDNAKYSLSPMELLSQISPETLVALSRLIPGNTSSRPGGSSFGF